AVFAVSASQTIVGPALLLPANLVVLVSLYTVTVYGPRWAGRVAMSGIVAGAAVLTGRSVLEFGYALLPQGVILGGVIVISGLAVWALAMLRRARREMLDALHDRAERLERERDQQAQISAAAERARIAREMHDVVAHSLSIVVAQADGGRYAARDDPAAAVQVLATISDTGRAALADLRRILGVLRDGADVAGARQASSSTAAREQRGRPVDEVAPRVPQPAVGDVAELLDGVRRAGLGVSVEEVGTPVPVTAGLELTVHRILQEALANVLKHAGPAPTVSVVYRWTADLLVLEVTDDGRGAASAHVTSGSGLGLHGMRERVGLFDGELHAGPRDGGGFRVRAELPLTTAALAAGPNRGPS
ncbi:MAG: sensor histidine kinase, partial [Nitriliruptoraceae bacterium]